MELDAGHAGKERNSHGTFPSRGSRDLALTRLLRREDVLSTQVMRELGFSARELHGLLVHGDLQRLHRGVYADGRTRIGARTRLKAALLAAGPTAFLSHRTAAAARDYRPINVRDIHLTVVAQHTPAIPGLSVHRVGTPPARGEVTVTGGLRASTLPRILLELAPISTPEELDELITAAERRNALGNMAEVLRGHAGRSGTRGLRAALDGHLSIGAYNSGLERAFWAWHLSQPDLPAPDATNVHLGPYEFDGMWTNQRLIVEIDGRPYHQARADMEKDRLKDAYAQIHGYRILRITDFRFQHDTAGIHADLLALLGSELAA